VKGKIIIEKMASTSESVPADANEGSFFGVWRQSEPQSSLLSHTLSSLLFFAGCVGPQSEAAGKSEACAGCPNQAACASGAGKAVDPAVAQVAEHLSAIKHKILVLSGWALSNDSW
jgi:hypothetical protein